jgi:hypothetical protein
MCPAKASKKKSVRKDVADTLGVRGAGVSWQADFGMPLNETVLPFAIRQ